MTDLNDHDAAAIRAIGLGPDNAPKFKVGQKWRRKDGVVITIEALDNGHCYYPMTAVHADGFSEAYTRHGQYYRNEKSRHDLTTLVADVDDAQPVKPEPVKTLRDEIAIAAMQAIIMSLPVSLVFSSDSASVDKERRIIENKVPGVIRGAFAYADEYLRAKEAK